MAPRIAPAPAPMPIFPASPLMPSLSIAWIHQGLGEGDQALDWLSRAVDKRDPKIVFLRTKPFWDGIRERPEFQALLRRMRLV